MGEPASERTGGPAVPPASDYRPSPIRHPEREFVDGCWTLVLTRPLDHPIDRVWAALTEPGQVRRWAPFSAGRDLAATGDVVLTMLGVPAGDADGGAAPTRTGRVLESDPPRLLIYSWGEDVLRWELTSTAGGGTLLVLRHQFDDGPMVSAYGAGWHLCLDAADALLSGTPIGPVAGAQARAYGWDDLNHRYAEALDVEPAVVPE